CTKRSSSGGRHRALGAPRAAAHPSPRDRPLLGRVHAFLSTLLEQKSPHVLGEEASCLGIHHVEAVMVDQHRLLPEPLRPAFLTDLRDDAGADGARERWTLESGARLSTAGAGDGGRHGTSTEMISRGNLHGRTVLGHPLAGTGA